jgi:hypothetical protein
MKSRGYHDPHYEQRLIISGEEARILELEHAAKWVKKRHTKDVIFNALCACHAKVMAISLVIT